MNKAIAWAKANPVTVAAIAVAVAAVGGFVYTMIAAAGFTGEIEDRQGRFRELQTLGDQRIEVPAEEADAPPETITDVAINEPIIETMRNLFDRMREEYEQVFTRAQGINRPDRAMIVEDLFPDPDRTGDLPFAAREAYRRAFPEMMGPFVAGGNETRLNAGEPPAAEEVGAALAELEREFRRQFVGLTGGGLDAGNAAPALTELQRAQLRKEKRELLLDLIRQRAARLHVYAETDPDDPAFPFVRNRALMEIEVAPSPSLLWEAQLELWIMQDVVDAIAEVNDVEDPDGGVPFSPVKRLISLEVLPGYVGLHTKGGFDPGLAAGGRSAGFAGVGAASTAGGDDAVYDPPAHSPQSDPDRRLNVAFAYTPTGRVSNALYDVRHARLVAVVEHGRLPAFFDALSRNNFMTVLSVDVADVDEFAALREGYFYGAGDCVEVDLLIETVWLREWTRPLMPRSVLAYLAVADVDRGAAEDDRRRRRN